jgi:hypothetical protein
MASSVRIAAEKYDEPTQSYRPPHIIRSFVSDGDDTHLQGGTLKSSASVSKRAPLPSSCYEQMDHWKKGSSPKETG